MAKMTKAQARKRLMEANQKINRVQAAALEGQLGGSISSADIKKLFPMMIELRKIAEKMRKVS